MKTFEAGSAVELDSTCLKCQTGTMSTSVSMSMEERMEARCGRLLWVKCNNRNCDAQSWAYR
jgi:hypothetical protein